MRNLAGRRVAITGASSGIGKAAALAFARAGCALALCARNEAALREVAEVAKGLGAPRAVAVRADVTSDADVRAFADAAGDTDLLVANAGVGQHGAFLDMGMDDVARVLDTNLVGVLRTVHAFGSRLQNGGHVIVVGSAAGKTVTPLSSVYAASKWALTGWTRSVRPELEARGIELTLFSPGGVDTDFKERRLAAPTSGEDARAPVPGSQSVDRVVKRLVQAARERPREVDLSFVGALGRAATSLAPHATAKALLKARQRRDAP